MSEAVRATVYRDTNVRVDVKAAREAWMAQVRVWRGTRWPELVGVWRARMRWWVPWFSLERQVVRALSYADRVSDTHLSSPEIRDKARSAAQWLRLEMGS